MPGEESTTSDPPRWSAAQGVLFDHRGSRTRPRALPAAAAVSLGHLGGGLAVGLMERSGWSHECRGGLLGPDRR
jgi:hypothetical protein